MVLWVLPRTDIIYRASYAGNLKRLQQLPTESVLAEYREQVFERGFRGALSCFLNPYSAGHVDAALEVLRERTKEPQ